MTAKPPAPALPFRVLFKDEAPAMGSGLRFVFARIGRKWVYLLCPYTLKACKLRLWKWKTLGAEPIVDPATNLRLIDAARLAVTRDARGVPGTTRFQRQVIGETK